MQVPYSKSYQKFVYRNNALTPSSMLLLTLQFYATGSFLIDIGDFAGVHKSTASVVVNKVSRAIAKLAPRYICFPGNEEDIRNIQQRFFQKARFPRCIGALDCTHVRIQSPGGDYAETYRNRKHFFSLNVQTVVDSDLKIRDIIARWPGSTHDSTIFNNSRIKYRFESGEMGNNILVGDSGYPIKKYLITPLLNPQSPAEHLFNESQICTRNPVERSYGVWKRRFPVLALGIRLKLDRVEAIIIATAVLHNIACEMNDTLPPVNHDHEDAIEFINNVPNDEGIQVVGGINNVTRHHLIHGYFQGLLNNL